MKIVQPHEFFRLDFDQILKEGKRQEELLMENIGEFMVVKNIHQYFSDVVIPLIYSNDWVYEAATRFATKYALDCIDLIRISSEEISKSQARLLELKNEVISLIDDARENGYIKYFTGTRELKKASDFTGLLKISKMPNQWKLKVKSLYDRIVDREKLHILTGLRGITDAYETNLPRIMFVVKRAIKVKNQIPTKQSDNYIRGISEDISWYERYIKKDHPLFPVLGNISYFYKVARNVGNHHKGFEWIPEKNIVVLEDNNTRLEITSSEFIQKMRYITVYICDLGLRGILSGYCKHEHGEISNQLVKDYIKIFPEDWDKGEKGKVQFY